MKAVVFLLSAAALSMPLSAREWQNPCKKNKNLHADLVSVTGKQGAEVVALRLSNGQTIQVPLANLTAKDQAYVRKTQAESPASQAK